MNWAFDGDSVACAYQVGVYHTWPYRVDPKGLRLCTIEATSEVCLARVPECEVYCLQLGQWSHNHESLEVFEGNVDLILGRVPKSIVLTPLKSRWPVGSFVEVLRRLALKHGSEFIDLSLVTPDTWILPDPGMCHLSVYGHSQVAKLVKAV